MVAQLSLSHRAGHRNKVLAKNIKTQESFLLVPLAALAVLGVLGEKTLFLGLFGGQWRPTPFSPSTPSTAKRAKKKL